MFLGDFSQDGPVDSKRIFSDSETASASRWAGPRKTSYKLGVAPSQDASDHQDDITFLVGDPYKPSFTTVTLRGPYPSYK